MEAAGPFYRQLDPRALYYYRRYEQALVGFNKRKNQHFFLRRCLQEQVIPSTFDVNLLNCGEAFPDVKRFLLKDRIFTSKLEVEHLHFNIRQCYNNLRYFFNRNLLLNLTNNAHGLARSISASPSFLVHTITFAT